MVYVKKKIPTKNIQETLMRCYELLCKEFPNLILDTRPERVVDWPVDDRLNYDEVFYKAFLQDGSKKYITEPLDCFEKSKKTSISQFLQFVRENNPTEVLKVICRWDSDNDEYKLTEFYDEGMRMQVKPSNRLFGGQLVKLEIEAEEKHKTKVQSIINKLQN